MSKKKMRIFNTVFISKVPGTETDDRPQTDRPHIFFESVFVLDDKPHIHDI